MNGVKGSGIGLNIPDTNTCEPCNVELQGESVETIVKTSAELIEKICNATMDIRATIKGVPTSQAFPTIGENLINTLQLQRSGLYEISEILSEIRFSL